MKHYLTINSKNLCARFWTKKEGTVDNNVSDSHFLTKR